MYSFNGYIWTHKDEKQQNLFTNKKMVVGDIITCEMNPKKNKLIYKNETRNTETTIDVNINAEDYLSEDFHPFIFLWTPGDTVEVLGVNELAEEDEELKLK